MISNSDEKQSSKWLAAGPARIPLLSSIVQRRGTAFAVSWLHRISGVLIVGFTGFHLLTLQALRTPETYEARMRFFSHPLLAALEWALALPVIFHAFNGGRLILFESFGVRRDDALLRGVIGLWLLYCGLLGVPMLTGAPSVSPFYFWPPALAAAVVTMYLGIRRIGPTAHALSWKLQRLSGLFLLVMVPAHLLFMHMDPSVAKDPATVLARLGHPFIKTIDFCLMASVIYHGAYGIVSIASDYLPAGGLRRIVTLVAAAASIIFGVLGMRVMFAG